MFVYNACNADELRLSIILRSTMHSRIVIQILHARDLSASRAPLRPDVDVKDAAMQIMRATAPHLAHHEVVDQCSPGNPYLR